MKVDAKYFGNIKSIEDRDDLTLVTDSQDMEALKNILAAQTGLMILGDASLKQNMENTQRFCALKE